MEQKKHEFTFEGHTYTNNYNGYYYRDGKRIAKKVYEEARYQHMQHINCTIGRAIADDDDFVLHSFMPEIKDSINHPQVKEDSMNKIMVDGHEYVNDWENKRYYKDGEKITKREFDRAMGIKSDTKPKRSTKKRTSKDVAFQHDGITVTDKQLRFLKQLIDCEGWFGASMWVEDIKEDIGGEFYCKPMTIGAMVSTLREKGIISVDTDLRDYESHTRKAKLLTLTESGRAFIEAIQDEVA